MKLAFDFVCDEAALFAAVARRFRDEGHDILGLTLGERWGRHWKDIYRVYPLDIDWSPVPDAGSELQRIEREYGDSFPGSFPIKDRFLADEPRERQVTALIRTFQAVEKAFQTERPDVYFSTGVAYLYNLVTLAVCKKNGIPHYSVYVTRGAEPRCTVSTDNGGDWSLVSEEYKRLLETGDYTRQEYDEALEYFRNFRLKAEQPFYMKAARQAFSLNPVFVKEFMRRMRFWYVDDWRRAEGDYLTQAPWWYAERDLKKIARAKLVLKRYDRTFDRSDPKDEFYLFPLHLQPEASTLILAEWYVNQLETIKSIARTLPLGRLLYVKEHRSALGRHTLAFYKSLRAIHNVKLIAHDENTPDLIRRSCGVIVLSSTVGWEALLLNRPVYVFGEVFYNVVKGVTRIGGFEDLRRRLAEDKAAVSEIDNKHHLILFLVAMKRQSFEGIFDVTKMDMTARVLDEDNIRKVHKGLTDIALASLHGDKARTQIEMAPGG